MVCLAGIAPYTGSPDWFDGMIDPGGPRAALEGREARARYAETAEFDERSFTAADYDILAGAWKSLGEDAGHAGTTWPDGLIDDDVASVKPWGFELEQVEAPVLVVQGGEDRVIPAAHAQQLLRGCPRAELWLRPRDGHVSILAAVPLAHGLAADLRDLTDELGELEVEPARVLHERHVADVLVPGGAAPSGTPPARARPSRAARSRRRARASPAPGRTGGRGPRSASISRANSAPLTSLGTTMFQHSAVLQSWSLSGRTVQARRKRSMAAMLVGRSGPHASPAFSSRPGPTCSKVGVRSTAPPTRSTPAIAVSP